MTLTPTRDPESQPMPRLPVEQARSVAAEAGMNPALADIHLFQMLLHAPHAAVTIDSTKDILLKGMRLDARLRELAIMRIAWLLGAEYVWNHHTKALVQDELELRPDDVLEVRDWERSTVLGDVERAVLALTDGMVRSPEGRADPAVVAALVELLGPDQVVELVVAVGLYRGIAGVIQTLDVPMEPVYQRWEPDGVAPA